MLNALPDDARLWLFAFDGPAAGLVPAVRDWLPSWTSHGRPVRAEAQLAHETVLAVGAVIAPEELNAGISGCGVDAMQHAVERAAADAGRALLPSLLITWQSADGAWHTSGRPAFRRAVAGGEVAPTTPVLDLTPTTLAALRRDGVVRPAGTAWTGRLFGLAPA